MAKNNSSQKKRVTHINYVSNNQYECDDEMQSGCFDYVYNIMRDMDSSMKSIEYSPADDSLKMELLSLSKNEVQNPTASSSNDCSQAVKTAAKKFKKFSSTRKFPLMEKSQKILKQLKHNRSIPKPRAHLASVEIPRENANVSKSSQKNKSKFEQKREDINSLKNACKTREYNSVKKSNPELRATDVKNKSKEIYSSKSKDEKKFENSQKYCELSSKHNNTKQKVLKTSCSMKDIHSTKNTQSDDISDGNTTDSEYERFIQNNKIELEKEIPVKTKKKHSKKKKIQKKNSHRKKILQNSFPVENLDQHDSNHLHDLSAHGGEKESEETERSISMEELVENYDSYCYDSSSDECGETDKKIGSTVAKSNVSINDENEKSLLNSKTVECNTGSNLEASSNLQCSFNNCEKKPNYCSFKNKDFSSEKPCGAGILVEHSNLAFNLDLSNHFEGNSDTSSIRSSILINENSTNSIPNSQGLQSTQSNLVYSSASECLSSNLDKCDKLPVEIFVIDLSSDSEQENTVSPQLDSFTVKKDNLEEFKKQIISPTNADSEESDIEVIEVVPASCRSKPATTCSMSVISSDNFNKITGVDSFNCKMSENEIKFSQTQTFENTVHKIMEPIVLDGNATKNTYPSLDVHLNEKVVKKEPKIIQGNNPVYMTGMCKEYNEVPLNINDPLGSSIPITDCVLSKCKQEKSETMHNEKHTVEEDDDIIVIEPPANRLDGFSVKEKSLDNDVIIDFVSMKKEESAKGMITHCVSSKENHNISIGDLESNIKSECPINCKITNIPNVIDNLSVGKKLPIMDYPYEKSFIEQNFSSNTVNDPDVLGLLEIYKKEFNMYQEIVRTEENVEAGLKMVEAHQAEKLKYIRTLIQNLVKSDPCFYKIYSDSVKTKEQNSLQASVQLKCFENDPNKNFQSSPSINFAEILCKSSRDSSEDLSSKLTSNLPSVHIKTEKDEKPGGSGSSIDPISIDINPSVERVKTEPGSSKISTALSCDLPSEDKQALKLLGKKCDVCRKDAVAACQRCAKAFFCSNECGKKFWDDGHERVCHKYV